MNEEKCIQENFNTTVNFVLYISVQHIRPTRVSISSDKRSKNWSEKHNTKEQNFFDETGSAKVTY